MSTPDDGPDVPVPSPPWWLAVVIIAPPAIFRGAIFAVVVAMR